MLPYDSRQIGHSTWPELDEGGGLDTAVSFAGAALGFLLGLLSSITPKQSGRPVFVGNPGSPVGGARWVPMSSRWRRWPRESIVWMVQSTRGGRGGSHWRDCRRRVWVEAHVRWVASLNPFRICCLLQDPVPGSLVRGSGLLSLVLSIVPCL